MEKRSSGYLIPFSMIVFVLVLITGCSTTLNKPNEINTSNSVNINKNAIKESSTSTVLYNITETKMQDTTSIPSVQQNVTSPPNDENETEKDNTQFSSLKPLHKAKQLLNEIRKDINNKDKEQITEMVITLIKTEEEECSIYNHILDEQFENKLEDKDYDYLEEIKKSNKKEDKSFKEFVFSVEDDGYEIGFAEGYLPFIGFSYDDIYNEFQNYVNLEYKEYLKIEHVDSPFGAEGILIASVDEIVGMIEEDYSFLVNYPKSIYIDEVSFTFQTYMKAYFEPYFEGEDSEENNVPIFGKNHIESLHDIAKKYEGTKLGDLMDQYNKLIEENNYKYTAVVQDFVDNQYKNDW